MPRVADELVEEGLLTSRIAPDGVREYALTPEGVELAQQLLRDSPSARAYQASLRPNFPRRRNPPSPGGGGPFEQRSSA